jgi:DNA-binding response OmpR family regulator
MVGIGDERNASSGVERLSRPPVWRILIVDDEPVAGESCKFALSAVRGYIARVEQHPLQVQQVAREWNPDLIILDVTMPQLDGFELARRLIADKCPASLMFVTGHDEPDFEVDGMELAEEYIKKPYDVQVLLARVRAVLRRRGQTNAGQQVIRSRENSRPVIDLPSRHVRVPHGENATLTTIEMRLLLVLLEHADQPVTYEELLRAGWGIESNAGAAKPDVMQRRSNRQLLHTNIARLRRKIESNPEQPELIITLPRLGYSYILKSDQP